MLAAPHFAKAVPTLPCPLHLGFLTVNSVYAFADNPIMRTVFFKVFLLLLAAHSVFAQRKPLYQLPETLPDKNIGDMSSQFLVGTDNGLFRITGTGLAELLWADGKVSQILKTDSKWYLVTTAGILSSSDLKTFTACNNGLPFLTIKEYDSAGKKLKQQPHLLKDLSVDPFDQNIMVTATKDAVYLTRNGGASWKSIGSMSNGTAGIKAVAVSHMPVYAANGSITGMELAVFMSHPIYGFSYYRADAAKPSWIDVSAGFAAMPSLTQPDEISDIVPVMCKNSDGLAYVEMYCAQSFIPNMYRFDWKTKRAVKIYKGTEQADTIDGLCQSGNLLVYVKPGKIAALSLNDNAETQIPQKEYVKWKKLMYASRSLVNSAYVPTRVTGLETPLQLSELWLLRPDVVLTPWGDKSIDKKAVYASVYQLRTVQGIQKYKKIIADNKLNAIVVDMKDDYGLLRFEPRSALIKKKGFVTQYKVDLDTFVSEFKKTNTYLIGRIVVFKDKHLATYDKNQYAIWDSRKNAPWVGLRGTENVTDAEGNVTGKKNVYYDENWVDPYSEEVWEYNIEIAKELIERGFDEIQFDYIRFPTDGINIGNASFRWRDKGMDKESALISFLSYARKNINAPIGIDIYGANGWYRSGTRTGQDVELMSEYVDVICPMFYPSHFEQNFLEYKPVEERPYRIYFYGSYRNTVIGRNHIVVRPWVQAFYLGVRYDRAYYNKDYVKREIFGVRDGLDRGYMHWNNSGGYYEDISPDPGSSEASPWKKNESDLQTRIPAFSSGGHDTIQDSIEEAIQAERERNKAMISIFDTMLEFDRNELRGAVAPGLLRVHPFFRDHD